jgi:arsenite methyltransferase
MIAARQVGASGRVVGIDMTPAMLAKARSAAIAAGYTHVELRGGYGETLPVDDNWADVVISNGVLNLMPDEAAALAEMARVLRRAAACRSATSSCRSRYQQRRNDN